MKVDFALDHVALALANPRHVGRDLTGYHAEVRALARQMPDLRAPNLVLGGQAGDVGARAADPLTLDHGGPPPRLRQMPRQQLAAFPAAEDEDVELFPLSHASLLVRSAPGLPASKAIRAEMN